MQQGFFFFKYGFFYGVIHDFCSNNMCCALCAAQAPFLISDITARQRPKKKASCCSSEYKPNEAEKMTDGRWMVVLIFHRLLIGIYRQTILRKFPWVSVWFFLSGRQSLCCTAGKREQLIRERSGGVWTLMLKKSCIFLPRSVKEPSSERKRGVEVRDPFCEKRGAAATFHLLSPWLMT